MSLHPVLSRRDTMSFRVLDSEAMRTTAIISTDHPVGGNGADEGDIIDHDSWDRARYDRNPVVLDGHYRGPGMCGGPPATPVGRGENLRVVDLATLGIGMTGRGQVAEVAWANTARGEELVALYRDTFMHSFSVGWRPRAEVARSDLDRAHPWYVDPKTSRAPGKVYRSNVLLEFSPVTIPADDAAVALRGDDHPYRVTWDDSSRALLRAALADETALGVVVDELIRDGRLTDAILRRLDRAPSVAEVVRLDVDPWIRALAEASR